MFPDQTKKYGMHSTSNSCQKWFPLDIACSICGTT